MGHSDSEPAGCKGPLPADHLFVCALPPSLQTPGASSARLQGPPQPPRGAGSRGHNQQNSNTPPKHSKEFLLGPGRWLGAGLSGSNGHLLSLLAFQWLRFHVTQQSPSVLGEETGTNFNKSECWLPCKSSKSRRESKVLSIREQPAWGFVKTAEEEAQCWVTASIGFWRLSCVKPKPHFLREGLWGEAVKCHLILSSDKTMRRNFAKLCKLNFFLLDVSLSFITGHQRAAQSTGDRPKENYITCITLWKPFVWNIPTPIMLLSRCMKFHRRMISVRCMAFYSLKIPNLQTLGKVQSVPFQKKHERSNFISDYKSHSSWSWPGHLPGGPIQGRMHLIPLL